MNIRYGKKIIIFLTLVITLVFIIANMNSDRKIESIKEKNNIDKKLFAMYVKNKGDDDYSEYTDSELFPNSVQYSFNKEKSYCVDTKDNIVSDAINYEVDKIKVTSGKTIYCYLYFDGNLFDIETDILVQTENGYKSVNETPTTNGVYNYTIRYDCTNNDAITSFSYNYYTHKYKIISLEKNKCNIYFDEMMPDIEMSIFINNYEVDEIPSNELYRMDQEKSKCTSEDSEIVFNDINNTIKIKTKETTKCNIYLLSKIIDVQVNIYINNTEVNEIPTSGTYKLSETKSSCTNSEAIITYDNSTKKIRIQSDVKTTCDVYLEGA